MDFLTVSQTWCRFNCTVSLRNFYANTRKVTSISDYAFSNCSSLASHEIPNNVESIGSHAFESSSKIKSIMISWKVTSIKEYAFYKCANLVSISIPEKSDTYCQLFILFLFEFGINKNTKKCVINCPICFLQLLNFYYNFDSIKSHTKLKKFSINSNTHWFILH